MINAGHVFRLRNLHSSYQLIYFSEAMGSNMDYDCDIAVVGAGPVGMLTALLLHQLGNRVHILERRPKRWNLPRAVTCYSQTLRILQPLGLLDEVLESKAIYPFRPHLADLCEWVGADGEIVAKIPFNGTMSRSGMDVVYGMNQMALDQLLENACIARGIPLLRGREVTGVDDHGSHVSIAWQPCYTPRDPPALAAEPHTTTALFVVGCDGARSAVRAAAGIEFLAQSAGQHCWLVLDVVPVPDTGGPYAWRDEGFFRQYNDPRRPCTSAPSLGFRRRIEFMLLPHEPSAVADDDDFVWGLLEPWGATRENAELARRTVFSPTGGWVDGFAKGRVVLAGDAAHNTPQFLGAGANTGLRDAKALAWRLDLAVKHADKADVRRLMEDYSREQHGIAELLVSLALDVEALIAVTDPVEARKRDEKMREEKISEGYPDVEALGEGGMYLKKEKDVEEGKDSGGTLFIHDHVVYGGKRGPFDVVVGQGWMLLGAGSEDPAEALRKNTRADFEDLFDGKAFHFGGLDGVKDMSGRYMDWFSKNQAYAVLVRPDFYIYGIAKVREEVDDIVKSALDHVFSKEPGSSDKDASLITQKASLEEGGVQLAVRS